MTFSNSITTCLSKYGIFKGRATRSEYWWFFLATSLPDCIFLLSDELSAYEVLIYIYYLFSLAVLVPLIAVGSRRLHDVGKSGWWQLLWVVPIIGWIFIIYWSAKEGDNEENKFGVPPTIEEQPIAEAAGKAKQEADVAEPAAENRETYYIRATKIIAGIVIVANLISLFVDLVLNEGDYGINFAFNAATIFGVVLPILIFGSFFGVIRLPVLSKMTNTYIGAMITALTVGVIPAWLVGLTWSVSYHGSYQFGIGGLIGSFIFLSILIPGPIAIIYRIAYMRLRKANAANVF